MKTKKSRIGDKFDFKTAFAFSREYGKTQWENHTKANYLIDISIPTIRVHIIYTLYQIVLKE